MPKFTLSLFFFLSVAVVFAQTPAEAIRQTGFALYQLEAASRLAADTLQARFATDKNIEKISGYLSYKTSRGFKTIFWNTDDYERCEILYEFTHSPELTPSQLKSKASFRSPTNYEKVLIDIRTDAATRANGDAALAQKIGNIGLTLIIYDDEQRIYAYLLPATLNANNLYMGADMAIVYNREGAYLSQSAIHTEQFAISPLSDGIPSKVSGKTFVALASNDPTLSATDICTLLLFRPYIQWEELYYTSPRFLCIFNVKTGNLSILPR